MKNRLYSVATFIPVLLIATLIPPSCKSEKYHRPWAEITVYADGNEVDYNQLLQVGTTITLDGSKSFDFEGLSVDSFRWDIEEKPRTSQARLSSTREERVTYTFDVAGHYEFSLQVHDGVQWGTDIFARTRDLIVVEETTVMADAGPDIATDLHEVVTLRGTNSTPNLRYLGFSWTVLQAPALSKVNTDSIKPSHSTLLPIIEIDEPGRYIMELYVSRDGENDRDTMVIFSNPPEIFAFSPAQGATGTEVSIAGKNFSSYPGGNIITFNGTLADREIIASDSMLKVFVPADATTGPIRVKIVETGDEAASQSFIVN